MFWGSSFLLRELRIWRYSCSGFGYSCSTVWSLAQELLYAMDAGKKKKKKCIIEHMSYRVYGGWWGQQAPPWWLTRQSSIREAEVSRDSGRRPGWRAWAEVGARPEQVSGWSKNSVVRWAEHGLEKVEFNPRAATFPLVTSLTSGFSVNKNLPVELTSQSWVKGDRGYNFNSAPGKSPGRWWSMTSSWRSRLVVLLGGEK